MYDINELQTYWIRGYNTDGSHHERHACQSQRIRTV